MAEFSNKFYVIKDPFESYSSTGQYAEAAKGFLKLLDGMKISAVDKEHIKFLCRAHYEAGYMQGTLDGMDEAKTVQENGKLL